MKSIQTLALLVFLASLFKVDAGPLDYIFTREPAAVGARTEVAVADGNNLIFGTNGAGLSVSLTAAAVKTLMTLNLVENTALSTWPGSTNVVTIGAATATSVNGLTIATGSNTATLTRGTAALTWNTSGTIGSAAFTAAGAYQPADGDLTIWAGITPGSGVGTFLTTPSSANFRLVLTDENGTGVALFDAATSPSFTTSITTPSTTFSLANTTATTVNAFGAATTLNIGAAAATVLNFGGSTSSGELRFLEPSGSGTNYTAIKAAAQAANITYTFPATVGGAGTFLRDAAGNGALDWAAVAGSGDVTAAAAFANDNRLIRSDGTGKGVQASGIIIDDSDNMTGVGSVTATSGTVTTLIIGGVAVTPTGTELNFVDAVTSPIQTQLNAKAPIASPTFTGLVIGDRFATSDGDFTTLNSFSSADVGSGLTIAINPNSGVTWGQTADPTLRTTLILSQSGLTAPRTTTIVSGDVNRIVTLFGNTTVPVFSQPITFVGPTAARTVTLPDEPFTAVGLATTQTLTGKTLTAPRIASGGFIADANGNEQIIFTTTASAVNEWTLANGATGVNPTLTASGETNVGLNFLVKGTGTYRLLATASGPTDLRLFEDADNGTNYVSHIAPATLAADVVVTDPSTTGTLPVIARQTFSNADATVSAGQTVVAQIGTMAAARTLTLAAANTYTAGSVIRIIDSSGTVTGANTIIIARAGSDTINGLATSITMGTAYGYVVLETDGSSKYTVVAGVGQPGVLPLTDGATITWTLQPQVSSQNASVTLAGNRTLAWGATPPSGYTGVLKITQDGTGTRTLALPANSKVISGGAGAITLTTTAAAVDILSWWSDGTNTYWTYGKNFN